MRVLLCVFLFIFAQTGEGKDYDDYGAIAPYKNKPVFHQNYQEPVPFGHGMPDGFGDPSPTEQKEALELLKSHQRARILFNYPRVEERYSNPSPKEVMLTEKFANPLPATNETILKWYDLAAMQARNATKSNQQQFIAKKTAPVHHLAEPSPRLEEKTADFLELPFTLSKHEELPLNWTTCDQFAVGAIFASKHVVNVKWTPFYMWVSQDMRTDVAAKEHTFEYPTRKLVNEFRLKFSKMVNETIDWTRAQLLMKGTTETLLIAADKRGLFHAIVKHEIPANNIQLPLLTLRLKVVNLYLVMTFCEEYYATVMAVSGNEPTDASKMKAAAATVKFIGPGRPVWKNLDTVRVKINAERDAKIREENEKLARLLD